MSTYPSDFISARIFFRDQENICSIRFKIYLNKSFLGKYFDLSSFVRFSQSISSQSEILRIFLMYCVEVILTHAKSSLQRLMWGSLQKYFEDFTKMQSNESMSSLCITK